MEISVKITASGVTVSIKTAKDSESSDRGAIVKSVELGAKSAETSQKPGSGGGSLEDPGTGGGSLDDPGTGGAVVVIGPIVIGKCPPKSPHEEADDEPLQTPHTE
jgi:hypothetical protein